jgi:hypothetical protein
MDDHLTAFLAARLDERETGAKEVLADNVRSRANIGLGSTLWDEQDEAARMELREVEADRAILALLKQDVVDGRERDYDATEVLEQVVRIRSAVYIDHPDYRPEWAAPAAREITEENDG